MADNKPRKLKANTKEYAGKKLEELQDLVGPVIDNISQLDSATKVIPDSILNVSIPQNNKFVFFFDSLLDNNVNPVKAKQTAYLILRGIIKSYPEQDIIPSFSLKTCESFVHFGYYYEFVSDVRQALLSCDTIIEFVELNGSTKYKLSPFFYDLYDHYCGTQINKDDIFTEKDLEIILQLQKLKIPITKIARFFKCSENTINYWLTKVKKRQADLSNVAGELADLESLELDNKHEASNVVSDDAIMRRGTWYYDKVIMAVKNGGIGAIPIKSFILVQKEYVNLKNWYETKQKLKNQDMLEEFSSPGEVQEILKQSFKVMDKQDVIDALDIKDPNAKKVLTDALLPYDTTDTEKEISDLIMQDIVNSKKEKEETVKHGDGPDVYRF